MRLLLISLVHQRELMAERLVEELSKETQLNNLVRKRKEQDFCLLYYSLWGKDCNEILKIIEEWKKEEGYERLYLINSWDLPHAFTAFHITRVPSLVKTTKGRIQVIDYYPRIYSYFKSGIRQES